MQFIKRLNINYVLLSVLILLKMSECAIDYDYYWQIMLGKEELLRHNFNNLSQIMCWGTKGLSEYLDHEWLTNIIFYIFSIIPFGIILNNVVFRLIFVLVSIKFIISVQKIEFKLSIDYVFILLALIFVSVHLKAYTLVLSLFMLELIMLYKYNDDKFKNYLFLSSLLVVFWNNIHSGTIIMYFIVAFMYFIINFNNINKKFLLIGLINLFCLILNPYGVRLLLFNFNHASLQIMYKLGNEWQSLDAKIPLGLMLSFVVITVIVKIRKLDLGNKNDLFYFVLTLFIIFMCFVSIRHIMYLIPCVYYLIVNTKNKSFEFDDKQFKTILSVVLTVVIIFTTGISIKNNAKSDYLIYYPEELEKIIYSNGTDNLFTCLSVDFLSVTHYNLKDFTVGAYPACAERVNDAYILADGCSDEYTEYIINKYNLEKFLICKLDTIVPINSGKKTHLYNYLKRNNYNILYEDDNLVYFKANNTK